MPGAALPELFMRIQSLHRGGRSDDARALFAAFLPLLALSLRTLDTFLWVQKEILRRRGVLTSARLRSPCEQQDPTLVAELDVLLAQPPVADLVQGILEPAT